MKKSKKKLNEALLKKALGYTTQELCEEYSVVDNELVLQKRKLNTKTYPPDLNALQILLSEVEENEKGIYDNYSLEELEKEREKLKKMLDEGVADEN